MSRDDFTELVRRSLALRAGHHCSFQGCGRLTAGPSAEADDAVSVVGEAAHICAAAPGGRRYRLEMTSEERRHITNGIWLCATHATLIDRDEVTYTVDRLHEMRRTHETWVSQQLQLGTKGAGSWEAADLLALGPEILFVGDVVAAGADEWELSITHFLRGDRAELTRFCGDWSALPDHAKYVLANELGDGRVLRAPPTWTRGERGLVVRCPTAQRAERSRAQDLGSDFALNNDLDLDLSGTGEISGVARLEQHVRLTLSIRTGEWFVDPGFGTRIAEYAELFADSPWLDRLGKLDVIRMASIPFEDTLHKQHYTPLGCVERVFDFRFLGSPVVGAEIPVALHLEVRGVGNWAKEVLLHISPEPHLDPADVLRAQRQVDCGHVEPGPAIGMSEELERLLQRLARKSDP